MVTVLTRDQIGLNDPESVSHDIRPAGLAVHWAGEALRLVNHAQCVSRWKQWQVMHMAPPRDWADIAYSWGICQHGVILTGRGWGVRTAANGSDFGNDRYLAACWLGGQGETPSAVALDAYLWLINYIRGRGAGDDVRPHSDFYGTACPGPVLTAFARQWDGRAVPIQTTSGGGGAKVPAPAFPLNSDQYFGPHGIAQSHLLAPWQRQMRLTADGIYGAKTRAATLALQQRAGLAADGLIGPKTWKAAWTVGP